MKSEIYIRSKEMRDLHGGYRDARSPSMEKDITAFLDLSNVNDGLECCRSRIKKGVVVIHPLLVNVIAGQVRGEKKWTEGPRDYGMKGININTVITDL